MFARLTDRGTESHLAMGLADDSSALDRLVREHLPAALRFAVRLTGDLDAAEEVVQEALLRVARGWQGFRGESQFRTWLFRIVINTFRDRCRVQHVADELPNDLLDDRATDPASGLLADELAERIARLVSALPPRQREVLVLSVYEGLATQEVAELLGTTAGNVRTNLHLARQRLRRQLAEYLTPE
jgi:RNA polymerase sigma-70 factor (ECF subfamily)